jgi:hypothetical protein
MRHEFSDMPLAPGSAQLLLRAKDQRQSVTSLLPTLTVTSPDSVTSEASLKTTKPAPVSRSGLLNVKLAAAYSPTPSQGQYHRR